ncbi:MULTISPECIES: bifunctional diaminohydroxyphosphoribosylaminopyrimidine deaminase/5-amino-6-(5-phosphoribosylamino)uracil reductase RibD [Lactobacillus]|uniref:Riboflavin biosynthesis protein RibD n=1 Tax=Lactobacillus xujianguonis TaxID=2495899 RepID=A0A437SY90_9LACO|nr:MULTISPECIES: bifunctional diaminohydroxyphosphoribosylaminopyrimidine deaminase/5-amino-6-(5-phosphoribosylamino)uracil reductase RibD [Lactobacillus]RVU71848.1 bifunctional diaminohydroxyphosphoribosylaminopyrimidine deaminase/5-amino-6-(5-phosphoribosylamino)uracil reductase RibD [Lactobacillus xujianguonis]RVU77624.1 bifunctional diaminohydroxyphosphoribosylaminopyrimidine deaminase/5-amino-6-(5-phosphoribosylamino)uracil reductase RibD [Lactobacillus xujianguonis]
MEKDQYYMNLALQEAKKGRYQTWKNPMVGAVVVKDDHILATGHHIHYGKSHAERDAISKLTPEQLFNSTLYVTLEPCNHYGKQPPCSDLIIQSKLKRVVIAQVDPHKLVTGKGIAKLRAHGIEVNTGILEKEAEELNQFYSFFYQNNRPWITVKQAVSLDYRVNCQSQTCTAITNQTVYDRVHQERADYQAILIGSNTALVDNPSLLTSVKTDYPPIRIILDRRGRLFNQQELKLLTDQQAPTWIFTQSPELIKMSTPKNVRIFPMRTNQLAEVMGTLTQEGIQSVYVEGGPTVAKTFVNEHLANYLIEYLSPNLLGKNGDLGLLANHPVTLKNVQIEQLADNLRIAGEINV